MVRVGSAAQAVARSESISVDGKRRPTTNSAGRLIHQTNSGIRNFWRWFGGSIAVDAVGRHLVVYHGTPFGDFDVLDPDEASSNANAVFFTASRKVAAEFATGEGITFEESAKPCPRVYSVYLRIVNPAIFDGDVEDRVGRNALIELATGHPDTAGGEEELNSRSVWEWYTEDAGVFSTIKARHFDGFQCNERGHPMFAIFAATQIKSVENSGMFDTNSPSLRDAQNAAC